MKTKHNLAMRARAAELKRKEEVYAACACLFPLVTYRNGHGHGKTVDGAPCPAIEVIQRHNDEIDAALDAALAEAGL